MRSKTKRYSLFGMPIMSQMIFSGSAAAMSVTKSQRPLSITPSTISAGGPIDVGLGLAQHAAA